jgi:hypothetical protein
MLKRYENKILNFWPIASGHNLRLGPLSTQKLRSRGSHALSLLCCNMSDTCQCRQILADIACRCDTEEAPTYPIYINYYRQVQISPNIWVLSYNRVFVFELKQQSRNYRHVGNPPTCRQMSCCFGHPADTTFSCVCDMTSDVSRHVADTTQNVAIWATKTTRQHPT